MLRFGILFCGVSTIGIEEEKRRRDSERAKN